MKFLAILATCLLVSTAFAGYNLGDEVADFKLKNVDSNFVSLADYTTARGVMLVFTSNDCQTANWYEDRMLELARKIDKDGWKTVLINSVSSQDGPNESQEGNLAKWEAKTYDMPYLRDSTQAVARAFGVKAVPTVVLLKCLGTTFQLKYIGAIDDQPDPSKKIHNRFVEMNVEAINSNQPSDTPMSKVAGCPLKYR